MARDQSQLTLYSQRIADLPLLLLLHATLRLSWESVGWVSPPCSLICIDPPANEFLPHRVTSVVLQYLQHCQVVVTLSGMKRIWICTLTPLDKTVEVTEGSVGRNSVVGIATSYGLNGPGIESRWGRDFPRPPRPALGHTQPPLWWESSLFLGDEAAGA